MDFVKLLISGLLLTCLPAGVSYAKMASGDETAAMLNQRYEKVVPDCNGSPSFYCSGVIIRTNERSGVPTWTPYLDGYLDSLQFSFLRKDLIFQSEKIWNFSNTGYGIIIFRDENLPGTRCMFALDAVSAGRNQYGCGDPIINLSDDDVDNSTCLSKGIKTLEQWEKLPFDEQCSFSTHDAIQFQVALAAANTTHITNNELIINSSSKFWDPNNPSKNGIKALWYNPDASPIYENPYGLDGAKIEQKLYVNLTKAWIPIIAININDGFPKFSYSSSDQAVAPF